MTDNNLIKAIREIILSGLPIYGIPDVQVKQSYQPTEHGANSAPTVYLFKVGDKRYGFNKRADVYNQQAGEMVHTETQYYETTFQINALVRQDPADINSLTASDIVNAVSAILQGDYAMAEFGNRNIGLLRVTQVRNPYFIDDKNRYEAAPSFDIVLAHKQEFVLTTPAVESVEFNVERV